MNELSESILVCPKCKSSTLFINELWSDHSIQWEQIDGKFDITECNSEVGNPYRLECECKKCKYRWKVRKYFQVAQIIKD